MPVHILSKRDEIAKHVIVVGDPLRAKNLSTLLESPKLVNENRCLLTYTGKWRGEPITIATHGVGAPSAAIVFEELALLGARNIVRLGTAGSIDDNLELGSVVIADSTPMYVGGCSTRQYFGDYIPPLSPSFDLLLRVRRVFERHQVKHKLGPVFCSDAFYAETPYLKKDLEKMKVLAVEMEAGILYALGKVRGFNALAILIISNRVGSHEFLDNSYLNRKFEEIVPLVFDALIS